MTIYFKKLECLSTKFVFVHQQNYWSESGGWDGQKVGKRGGQMDGQPGGQVGGQEIGYYRMVDGVGSMLCPPERFKCCWVEIMKG